MKGGVLYAIVLGRPADGKVTVRSLAKQGGGGEVTGVSLLGSGEKLEWTREDSGLVVKLPGMGVPEHAFTLRITGRGLKPAPVEEIVEPVRAGADGGFVLTADEVVLHGEKMNVESRGGKPNIGFWDNAGEWASWTVEVPKPGRYRVEVEAGGPNATELAIRAGGRELVAAVPATGSWDKPLTVAAGDLDAGKAGPIDIEVRPKTAASWKAVNLWSVRLVPAGK